MNRAVLKSFLRSIADPATPDADVLARYRDGRDAGAFAEIVARYGRLVWSVCKHRSRTEADAEDAFQATFLVFSQRASSVRTGTALGAWLYGVASRVCSKAHRAAERRVTRERANGVREATNDVAASAWDRALAAVHEEVETLPDSLRVPFVLCALEGRSPSDAAASLGWKLGTFSGRLTRAKDAMIAKLDARGLTAGAVAAATVGVNVSDAPAAVVAKTLAFASRGAVVPQTILHLTQGVLAMNVTRVKILAAAVLVACGLASGVGSQWVATAQDPVNPVAAMLGDQDQEEQKKKVLHALQSVYKAAKDKEAAPAPKSKWEYAYRDVPAKGITQDEFQSALQHMDNDGWAFVGQVTMNAVATKADDPKAKSNVTLVRLAFRRPVRVEASADKVLNVFNSVEDLARARQYLDYKSSYQNEVRASDMKDKRIADLEAELAKKNGPAAKAETRPDNVANVPQDFKSSDQSAVRVLDDKNDRIAQLEAQIAKLKGQTSKDSTSLALSQKDVPLGVAEMQDILGRVASKIGTKNLEVMVTAENGGTIHITGPKDSVEWARRLIETLGGKSDPASPVRR